MKILVPVNALEQIHPYAEAGAGEFYMGFHDSQWEYRFGAFADVNRMSGFGRQANRYELKDLPFFIDSVHQHGGKAYITLNAAHYSREQQSFLANYCKFLYQHKADGIIVSNPEVAVIAQHAGIKAVASTMCDIRNQDIASYYIWLGVKRIILPRELALDEIACIVEACPDAEYEVFLMRSGCVFSDSHCLGFHGEEGALCRNLCRAHFRAQGNNQTFMERQKTEYNEAVYRMLFRSGACGLCALYRLKSMNISAGKVVGRAEDPRAIVKDIQLVQTNLDIAAQCTSEEEYLQKMAFPEHESTLCLMGKSCYYPEVRFSGRRGM